MGSNRFYDERQLIERGKIYQQAFFLVLGLLGIDTFLKQVGIVWTDDFSRRSIVFMIPIAYALIRIIWADAYGNIDCSRINFDILLGGAASLWTMCSSANDMIREHIHFISNGQLSSKGALLIDGFCVLLITVTHLIKVIRNKRADADKDEWIR